MSQIANAEFQKAQLIGGFAKTIVALIDDFKFIEAQLQDEALLRFYNFPAVGPEPTDEDVAAVYEVLLEQWAKSALFAELLAQGLHPLIDE